MGRIRKHLKNHLIKKHNLTVNVNEKEGVVTMSQETFSEILSGYGELIYANTFYTIIMIVTLISFAVIISWT